MARSNFVQTSFRQGEWSPFSQGRIDEDEYYAALNICADFQPVDAGALVRRSGSKFVATIDVLQGGTSPYVDLYSYDTDDDDHYVCVLTPGNMQFFDNGSFSTSAGGAISSISTNTDPAVFTTDAVHGLVVGDLVVMAPDLSQGAAGTKDFINAYFKVLSAPTTSTFTVEFAGARSGTVNGSTLPCFYGNSTVSKITEVTLPYTSTDLALKGVKDTQDSDYLYLFHTNHIPQLIDKTLALTNMSFSDGPYFELNEETTTLALSALTGSVTVTASSIVGINGGVGFLSTDVGRHIRFQDTDGNWTWLIITVLGSTTSVTATIEGNDAGATTAVTTWRLGLYSDTTGWPTHGVFHELRLWLISDAQTKRVDGSNIILDRQTPNGAFRFSPTSQDGTVADRHSPSYILNSQGRNRFNWLSADDTGLLGGTSDGVWVISASAQDDPLTPTSIQARRKSRFKSADKMPALVNRSTIFIGDLEKEVIEIRRYQAGYDAKNVSREGEHLLSSGVEEIHYANTPIPTLWGRTSDKRLVGASFRRDVDGEQTGWHQHNMEYTLDPTKTAAEGNVEAIVVVKQSDKDGSNIDTLWMINERNGFYCLEYMTPLFNQSRIDLEGFFVDGGVPYDATNLGTSWELTNTATNEYTFYGLWHLEGNVVDVVFRTLDLGQVTVSGGQISIVVPPAALSLPASYSTYADTTLESYVVIDYEKTFATGYIADTAANPRFYGNGGMFLEGTDGVTYMLTGDASGNQYLTDIQTGVRTSMKNMQEQYDDLAAKGQDPLGNILSDGIISDGTRIGCAIAIRNTPYVVFMGQWTYAGGSPAARYGIQYYRIDGPNASDMVYVGGYMDHVPSTGASIYPHIRLATQPVNVHFLQQSSLGVANASILITWGTWDSPAEDQNYILKLPSVNDAILQGFTTDYTVHSTRQTATPLDWMELKRIIVSTYDQDDPWANRAFMAPVQNASGALLMSFTSRMLVEGGWTGTTYIDDSNLEYPQGWVTGIEFTDDAFGNAGTVGDPEIMNCRVREDGSSVIPFADGGQNKDGDYTSDADDYQNPFFFPIDEDNPNKPWLVFWPKIYNSVESVATTGTYLRLKIFQWDPLQRTMSLLDDREGSMFDTLDDLGVSRTGNEMQDIAIHWDKSDGTIYIASAWAAGDPIGSRNVISTFGTIVINTDEVAGNDILKQEMLNRGFDATIGLNYVSRAQLLRPQRGSNGGPDLGKTRRVDQFAMITHRTGPFKIGTSFDDGYLENVTPDETILETGQRPLYTGVIHGNLADDYGFNGQIAWEMDRPGPGSYLAVGGFRNTQDR